MNKRHYNQSEFEKRYRHYSPRLADSGRGKARYSRRIDIVAPPVHRTKQHLDKPTEEPVQTVQQDTAAQAYKPDVTIYFDQQLKQSDQPAKKKRLTSRRKILPVLTVALLFFVSGLVVLKRPGTNEPSLLSAQNIQTDSSVQAAANENLFGTLQIEKIELNAKVTYLPKSSSLQAPKNKSEIGFVNNSALPTEAKKAVVLTGKLAFANLNRLQVGDSIKLEQDGQTYSYEVITTRVYPLAGLSDERVMNPYDEGFGLNLVAYPETDGTVLVVYGLRI